jgi:DNA-binding XRE family transcriptional regulator
MEFGMVVLLVNGADEAMRTIAHVPSTACTKVRPAWRTRFDAGQQRSINTGDLLKDQSAHHRALIALSRTIGEVRLSKGITQEKLALLAEVDRSYVGRIERGDNNVAVLTLSRLAAALDISVAKLMLKAGL